MNFNEPSRYDRFLKKAALKWGASDPDEAKRPHKIVKTLIFEDKRSPQKIEIFTYNGQYGYCLAVRLKREWSMFGPFLGFSDPYPTCRLALNAAILEIVQMAQKYGSSAEKRRVGKWAKGLITPKQLRLI